MKLHKFDLQIPVEFEKHLIFDIEIKDVVTMLRTASSHYTRWRRGPLPLDSFL